MLHFDGTFFPPENTLGYFVEKLAYTFLWLGLYLQGFLSSWLCSTGLVLYS